MQYPLQIYVVWQPEDIENADQDVCFDYAKEIFSAFNRTIDEALDRDIGIPTYFLSEPGFVEAAINWQAASNTVVVWMITDTMLLERREEWQNDVQRVLDNAQTLLIPVALTANVDKFYKPINGLNGIELQEEEDPLAVLLEKLTFKLAQELCNTTTSGKLPLTLFLSHARKDGKYMAKEIHQIIHQLELNLNSFLDVRNIEEGSAFEEVINNSIDQSVFLIINTNAYNEREWCLKELLLAKQKNRPIVVVNAQKDVTHRTWPYLGNTPVVQLPIVSTEEGDSEDGKIEDTTLESLCGYKKEFRRIIYYVLMETLRYAYQKKLLETRVETVKIQKNTKIFSVAPELLTMCQQQVDKGQLVLYPDPPLGDTETKILDDAFDAKIITSTLYPLLLVEQKENGVLREDFSYDKILKDFVIGLSVSDIPLVKPGLHRGIGLWHLRDAIIELTRYLFVCGATCAYGGSIKNQVDIPGLNFTTVLLKLLKTYNYDHKADCKIINHVAAVFSESTKKDKTLQSDSLDLINFVYHNNQEKNHPSEQRLLHYPEYTPAQKAICFTDMRKSMFEQYNEAQIFMGGKMTGYISIISGILEEAYWALKNERPIYIIGAFGGVSGALADLFHTGSSLALQQEFEANQQKESWKLMYKEYIQEIQDHTNWKESPEDIEKRVQYQHLKLFFMKHREKHKETYLFNGLNRSQNEILFTSKNILEISSLILEGLHNYFNLRK